MKHNHLPPICFSIRIKALICLLLISLSVSVCTAQSTWTGATNSLYGTSSNWSPSSVPANGTGTALIFNDVTNQVIDLASTNRTLNTMSFNSSDDYTFSSTGATLTMALPFSTASTITQSGIGAINFDLGVVVSTAINNVLTLAGSGAGAISFNNGLSGLGNFYKNNSSTVNLEGSTTFTGTNSLFTVRQGILSLNPGATMTVGDLRLGGSSTDRQYSIINSTPATSVLTIDKTTNNSTSITQAAGRFIEINNNGTFQLLGNTSANSTATMQDISAGIGLGTIRVVNGNDASTSSRLTFNSLLSSGSMLNIDSAGGTLGANTANGARVIFATDPSGFQTSTGILKSSTIANQAGIVIANGTNYAKYDTTVVDGAEIGVRAFTAGEYSTTLNGGSTTDILNIVGSGTLSANRQVNALRIESTASGQSLNLGSSFTINYGYGLIFTGTDDYTITGTGTSLFRTTIGNSNIFVNNRKLTIDSPWSSSSSIVKAGDGQLDFAGNVSTATTALTLTVADGASSDDMTISGVISGTRGFFKTGEGSLVLGGSSVNTFTLTSSGISMDAGKLVLAKTTTAAQDAALGNVGANGLTFTSGVIEVRNQDAVISHNLTIAAGGVGDTLHEFAGTHVLTFTGNVLTTGRTVTFSNTAGVNFTGATFGLSSGSSTTTFNGSGRANFSTVLQNGGGTLSITKEGSGSLYFNAVNTYTGATTLRGGTIGGNGTISSLLTVQAPVGAANSILTAGTPEAVGTLTLAGGLDASATNLTFDFGLGGSSGAQDLLVISGGTYTLNSLRTYTVNLTDFELSSPSFNTPITLIDVTGGSFVSGGATAANFALGTIDPSWILDTAFGTNGFNLTGAGDLEIQLLAVPEPSSVVLVLLGVGSVLIFRKLRIKAKSCISQV